MDFKKDFPIFQKRPNLIYFDNGATSQKPQVVLDKIAEYYENHNSNIHRGPHFMAEEATVLYEEARRTAADFIGARNKHEIIFTRNATEGINLVARSFGESLGRGDAVLLSHLEHHSNIVPWLQLKERRGIEVRYIPLTEDGQLDFKPEMINEKVKLVSITGMSNALGTITDLKPIIKAVHKNGAKVLVDAAQLAVHEPINVHELDIDFLVFTGHKLYGPTGIGVLYGKEDLLNAMPSFLGGGDMINECFTDHFIPAELPQKFEAGTPNIAGAVGLKAAIDYVLQIGLTKINRIEKGLTKTLLDKLSALSFINLIGPMDLKDRGSIVSFMMKGVHPHDIAEGLSQNGICIRAGHHCTQILMDSLHIPGTARISLSFYNTTEEIDKMVKALEEIYDYFK